MHAITKLKYFGMTARKDVHRYLGSGIYWKNHIQKHGTEHVMTLQTWKFEDQDSCQAFAQKLSKDNQIATSDNWANLVDETGSNGWPKTWPIGAHAGAKNGMFGRNHSDDVKEASRRRLADTNARSRWYNDGTTNKFSPMPLEAPWKLGRIINAGCRWYHNGQKQTFTATHPGEGWQEGSLKTGSLCWFNNGIVNKRFAECPEGWKPGMFKTKT